jgi:hypothetical protein
MGERRADPGKQLGPAMADVGFRHPEAGAPVARAGQVHPEDAEAAAAALAEAIGGADLVTKGHMPAALRDLEQRLTTKFGNMLIVAVAVILAALRGLPATHP